MEATETKSNMIDFTDPKAVASAVKDNGGKPLQMRIYFLHGIFGELPNCNGVAEEMIDTDEKLAKYGLDPAEGGTYIKLIGNTFLYKGDPNQGRVFGIEQAKTLVSMIPREIIGKSLVLSAAVGSLFLFARKKFMQYLHIYFFTIKQNTIRHQSPPAIRMKKSVREIRRAMDVALKMELEMDPQVNFAELLPSKEVQADWKLVLGGTVMKATEFLTLIMELDGAYCFPMQDILGEIDWYQARDNGMREFWRILNLFKERNTNLTIVPGISDRTEGAIIRFPFIFKALRVMYWLSPRARRITRRFLMELDTKKVGLDEADWYFCLRRNTHNYRGIPLPERLAELERIDAERKHMYVKVEYKQQEKIAEVIPGQKNGS